MAADKFTVQSFRAAKAEKRPISMLTAYDYTTACLLDEAGVDSILVGDSLGMVMLGYENTLRVTMDEMIHHTRAVARGTRKALLIGDMPFLSYHVSVEEAVRNAGRFIQDGGAEAVKLEGGAAVVEKVRAIVKAQIPVLGHLGLTPQSVNVFGGFKVQGKDVAAARNLLDDALLLQDAGAFGIVLECVPDTLAGLIRQRLDIPTIGIGAGPDCDGQVLVIQDLLGLYRRMRPKFVKTYADLGDAAVAAVKNYVQEVAQGQFPAAEHSFHMDARLLEQL
ncbi:MAG: 3-methyl-2-oxobutanoate hydroxymethyltransferase [Desulfatitalea sp.]|nr:3-methyl-2-oxobutanoate hydroxymethyltransferase [Desulfatitalea sp.]